jgi:hypothetical protein
VLGHVVPPFLLANFYVMAANVAYVRDRIGLPRRQPPARFFTLMCLAAGAFVVGSLLVYVPLAALPEGATQEQVDDAISGLLGPFLGFLLATAVLLCIAYHGLQRDINELWDAHAARVAYLRANPPLESPHAAAPWGPSSAPAALGLGPAPRYYADLGAQGAAPASVLPPAAPPGLADRWAGLRAVHPDLAGTPGMDALLARAETDPGARAEAEARLVQLEAALRERGHVLRRREALLAAMEDLEARVAQGLVGAESYDAERTVMEREWETLRAQLDLVDERVSRLA